MLAFAGGSWHHIVSRSGELLRHTTYTYVRDLPLYKLPVGLDRYYDLLIDYAVGAACLSGLHRLCTQVGAPDDWWDYVHTLPYVEWRKYKLETIMPSLMEVLCFPK